MGFDADWHAPRVSMRRAEIKKIDDSGEQQFADVQGLDNETFEGVYRAQTFGISGNPPVGSDGILLMLGGRPDQVMLIGTEHPGSRPKNTPAGCKVIYNQFGDIISLLQSKIRVVTKGVEVQAQTIAFEGEMSLKGNLKVEGDITNTGDMKTDGTHTDSIGHHKP